MDKFTLSCYYKDCTDGAVCTVSLIGTYSTAGVMSAKNLLSFQKTG
jgi:hypothetical protein